MHSSSTSEYEYQACDLKNKAKGRTDREAMIAQHDNGHKYDYYVQIAPPFGPTRTPHRERRICRLQEECQCPHYDLLRLAHSDEILNISYPPSRSLGTDCCVLFGILLAEEMPTAVYRYEYRYSTGTVYMYEYIC